jgi:hypothetical protein
MPVLISAQEFLDRFIDLAKKAKAKFPEIKISGPVLTSEWHWYNWKGDGVRVDGKYYTFLEYFIKRCADEEAASGIRVLDVVDIHHYPYAPSDNDALQNHRIFYDTEYNYPGANGLKKINGGWDNSLTKEYIFKRIEDWLTLHFGEDHGITLGLSEWSPGPSNPNLASVIYGTHLGTFANHGVDFFSPWSWFTGMWETLHLYSRYAKGYSVLSTSTHENTVSAYTTVNEASDSMTVIIVNRSMNAAQNVTVNLNGFSPANGNHKTLQLASLPATETFTSHSDNALKENSVFVTSNSFSLAVPPLSTTAVLLSTNTTETITGMKDNKSKVEDFQLYPNPVSDELSIRLNSKNSKLMNFTIHDNAGRVLLSSQRYYDGISPIQLDISAIPNGFYLLSIDKVSGTSTGRFIVFR